MGPLPAAVALLTALAAPRQAAPPAADPASELGRQKACLRAVVQQVSKVAFDRKDVERFLAEWRSFDALEGLPGAGESGPECFKVEEVLADPTYLAWARSRGLEPRAWLLASVRISMTWARRSGGGHVAEAKAQLEAQRRELTARCASMGPTACADLEKGLAAGEAAIRSGAELMALFPEPSAAEARLLDQYGPRLDEAMGSEGEEDGDGPPGRER